MSHSIHNKKLLARIRKIKGQAQGLENMLVPEIEQSEASVPADCMKVLQQIAALKGAVNGLMMEVLEEHLREHLGVVELTQAQREQEVDQVISVLKTYVK